MKSEEYKRLGGPTTRLAKAMSSVNPEKFMTDHLIMAHSNLQSWMHITNAIDVLRRLA